MKEVNGGRNGSQLQPSTYNTMKKMISTLSLVLVLCMSLTIGASAASYVPDDITYQNLTDAGCFELTLEDDGRGVNVDKLKNAAIQRGVISVEDEMSFENILNLMFTPGVTTNEQVSEYSGRGVGMDVVWH